MISRKCICIEIFPAVGDIVYDDLTGKEVKVLKILIHERTGTPGGYVVDSDYLGGGRNLWEVTEAAPNDQVPVPYDCPRCEDGPLGA